MDEKIKRIIIGSALLGVGKITFLQLRHGEILRSPSIVPFDTKGKFGVEIETGEDDGCTRIIDVADVETVY